MRAIEMIGVKPVQDQAALWQAILNDFTTANLHRLLDKVEQDQLIEPNFHVKTNARFYYTAKVWCDCDEEWLEEGPILSVSLVTLLALLAHQKKDTLAQQALNPYYLVIASELGIIIPIVETIKNTNKYNPTADAGPVFESLTLQGACFYGNDVAKVQKHYSQLAKPLAQVPSKELRSAVLTACAKYVKCHANQGVFHSLFSRHGLAGKYRALDLMKPNHYRAERVYDLLCENPWHPSSLNSYIADELSQHPIIQSRCPFRRIQLVYQDSVREMLKRVFCHEEEPSHKHFFTPS